MSIVFDSSAFRTLTGVTHATINTETAHAHGLGTVPRFYAILPRGNGVIYESKPADAANIYIKGAVTVLPFTALVMV